MATETNNPNPWWARVTHKGISYDVGYYPLRTQAESAERVMRARLILEELHPSELAKVLAEFTPDKLEP